MATEITVNVLILNLFADTLAIKNACNISRMSGAWLGISKSFDHHVSGYLGMHTMISEISLNMVQGNSQVEITPPFASAAAVST